MPIDERFLEELNARCDIVDIVSRYVQLKKRGSNYFGLCPFHNEKTPSFSVAPDKQIFYCFGCGAGGGPLSFIMRAEGLEFPDAVRFLAREYNMTVPETGGDPGQRHRRERILAALRDAARFYYSQLHSPAGEEALRYVQGRALSRRTLNEFGLGYAPDSFTATMDALVAKGYTKDELFAADLLVRNKRGTYYDRFRNRVMFPIIDVRGDVIGFGGRVMDDSKPKYLNSSETPVFNKRRNLFAMNRAKKTKNDYFLLAEGYMDVIALHQAGFDSAVASLGTSLTEEQARLLSRYTKTVVICYDADAAGQNAAQRAIDILRRAGLGVKILKIPGAKDPDEYIKSQGAEAFRKLIERSGNPTEYRLAALRSGYDLTEDEQRIEYLREAAQLLAQVENPIERDVYTASTAKSLNIRKEALEQEVRRAQKQAQRKAQRQQQRQIRAPVQAVQPKTRGLHYDDPKSAKAEMGVLSLVFSDASLLDELEDKLRPEEFSAPLLGKIYAYALELYHSGRAVTVAAYAQQLTQEEMNELVRAASRTVPTGDRQQALADYVDCIHSRHWVQAPAQPERDNMDPLLMQAQQRKRKNGGYQQ